MAKKFRIWIKELTYGCFDLEAESKKEAKQKVMKALENPAEDTLIPMNVCDESEGMELDEIEEMPAGW